MAKDYKWQIGDKAVHLIAGPASRFNRKYKIEFINGDDVDFDLTMAYSLSVCIAKALDFLGMPNLNDWDANFDSLQKHRVAGFKR